MKKKLLAWLLAGLMVLATAGSTALAAEPEMKPFQGYILATTADDGPTAETTADEPEPEMGWATSDTTSATPTEGEAVRYYTREIRFLNEDHSDWDFEEVPTSPNENGIFPKAGVYNNFCAPMPYAEFVMKACVSPFQFPDGPYTVTVPDGAYDVDDTLYEITVSDATFGAMQFIREGSKDAYYVHICYSDEDWTILYEGGHITHNIKSPNPCASEWYEVMISDDTIATWESSR